jgi:hypothetical protein
MAQITLKGNAINTCGSLPTVASIAFKIPGWSPERVEEVGVYHRINFYLYRIPIHQ